MDLEDLPQRAASYSWEEAWLPNEKKMSENTGTKTTEKRARGDEGKKQKGANDNEERTS